MPNIFFFIGVAVAAAGGLVIGRKWNGVARELVERMKGELAGVGFYYSESSTRFLLSRMTWQPRLLFEGVDSPSGQAIIQRYVEDRKRIMRPFKWAFVGCVFVTVLLWFTQVFVDVYFQEA